MPQPEKSFSVKLSIKTKGICKEFEGIIPSVPGFHLQPPDDSGPCDILVMEMGNDPERDFELIKEILGSKKAAEVFLTSGETNPEILLKALRTGIKEFLPQPVKKDEVRDAFIRFNERKKGPAASKAKVKNGRIIDIIGSKGGVGATTVAVNLAASLVDTAQSVALIDMNPFFGEVPLFLGIDPAFNWMELAENISRMDSTYLMSILSKHSSGVFVLPAPAKFTKEYRYSPEAVVKILGLMRTMFDFIVIDGRQSVDELSGGLLKTADLVLVIAILSLPCLINVKKLLSIFRDFGYPSEQSVQIIVNKVNKKSFISIKEAEESIKKKVLWDIPDDHHLATTAINQGKPFCILDHKAQISKSFKDLSALLKGKGRQKKKGLFGLKILN